MIRHSGITSIKMQGKVKPIISPKPKFEPGSSLSYRPGRPLTRTLAVKIRQNQKTGIVKEDDSNKQSSMSCVSGGECVNGANDREIEEKVPSDKCPPLLSPEKLSEKRESDSLKGIQKASTIPASSAVACRTKYQGVNLAARSKSLTKPKRLPSNQFYVTLTPPQARKSSPPPVHKKPSYVGSRLATSNAVVKDLLKVSRSRDELLEVNGSVKEVPELNGSTIEVLETDGSVTQLSGINDSVTQLPEINDNVAQLPEIVDSVAQLPGIIGGVAQLPEAHLEPFSLAVSKVVTEQNSEQSDNRANDTESKRGKEFLVAKEMMTSEKVFVDVLRLLNEDFREAVKDSDIPENNLNFILNCLPHVLKLNEELLKEMEERIENWDEIGRISDVIVRIGPFLKLYTSYIKSFSSLTESLEDACKKYPQFSEAVKQFERSSRCQRLGISHYMLKPVQRIPQYKLLLQDYLKCLKESSSDYQSTIDALAIVSEVAEHANETIKHTEHFEKLMDIQARLSGGFQVIAPGRSFLREGELLKLCRKGMQTRKFFLFSDCLLHCSMTSLGLFRVHHVLKLASMKLNIPSQEDYRTEFSIISEARSFPLSANSPEERDDWVECLTLAIENMSARMETFLQGKIQKCYLKDTPVTESLGNSAPVWIPDARVTLCPLCTREFSLTFRRHHCRACGKVVCAFCSANQAPLRFQNYAPGRVCDVCFKILRADFDQMEKQPRKIITEESEKMTNSPALWQLKGLFKKSNVGSTNFKKPDLRPVLTEVCASGADCSMQGYLYTRVKKNWKKQWFVIKDKVLYAFKASEDAAALNSTPLLGFDVITFTEDHEGIPFNVCFRLNHLNHAPLFFYADNSKLTERWVEAMKDATVL